MKPAENLEMLRGRKNARHGVVEVLKTQRSGLTRIVVASGNRATSGDLGGNACAERLANLVDDVVASELLPTPVANNHVKRLVKRLWLSVPRRELCQKCHFRSSFFLS